MLVNVFLNSEVLSEAKLSTECNSYYIAYLRIPLALRKLSVSAGRLSENDFLKNLATALALNKSEQIPSRGAKDSSV